MQVRPLRHQPFYSFDEVMINSRRKKENMKTNLTNVIVVIEQLITRFNYFGDAGELQKIKPLLDEKMRYELPNGTKFDGAQATVDGLAEVAKKMDFGGAPDMPKYLRHHRTSSKIDIISETEAQADTYHLVLTDKGLDHWGRWQDRFVKRGDEWLFIERKVVTEGMSETSWFKNAGV
jgi:SnoaL-like domain